MTTLGRRMFFNITNESGRDKCAHCQAPAPKMVKHMATGLCLCRGCLRDLTAIAAKDEPPEYQPPDPLPPGMFDRLFPYLKDPTLK